VARWVQVYLVFRVIYHLPFLSLFSLVLASYLEFVRDSSCHLLSSSEDSLPFCIHVSLFFFSFFPTRHFGFVVDSAARCELGFGVCVPLAWDGVLVE